MNNKNYTSINDVLKSEFAAKVVKLSLDGGFTCPNRDGTLGSRGGIFPCRGFALLLSKAGQE